MAKRKDYITPEDATLCITKHLARNLQGYAGICNAVLSTIDYVEGPVWAMQLYNGPVTHWAILEEIEQLAYVYAGPLKPQPIFLQNQVYHRKINRNGKQIEQTGCIKYDRHLNVCIHWVDDKN